MIKDNWLNTVSSGTYKFTFYVVSNDVWNDARSGVFNEAIALNSGQAVIIAEDGVEGAYAVQNVMIKQTAGQIKSGHTNTQYITCDLLEPLGFGLLDRLLTVGEQLGNGFNVAALKFVLKLDFLGRDPGSGATKKYDDPFIYALSLRNITGSLGAAGARYFLELDPQESLAQLDTNIVTDTTIENVTTVKTFAENLEIALNNYARSIEPVGHPTEQAAQLPNTTYKVVLDPSTNVQAIDYANLPAFDLSSQPWAGTADSGTSGGQSESLEELGVRNITINNNTQLTAKIRELIAINVPSYAEYNAKAQETGLTYEVIVQPELKLLHEMDERITETKKEITLIIRIKRHGDILPPDQLSIKQLRTTASVQQERFENLVLPNLVKKYTYQYTGENTEVTDIDLQLNNIFYNALAPAAAVYYADNNNMFEANLELSQQTSNDSNPNANVTPTPPGANVRYLSDVPIQKYNILQSPVFRVQPVGPQGQQVNETTTVDKIANLALINHAARTLDSQNLTIETRGDPIFMGRNGKTIFDNSYDAIYCAFINFQPNAEDLLLRQQKGPVDLITTGVYKIMEITSKFQQGSFTQTVTTLRDDNSSSFLLLDTLINLEVE